MKGYGFPTAPDGQRLLMMRFRPPEGPEPVILRLGEAKGTPVTTIPGPLDESRLAMRVST